MAIRARALIGLGRAAEALGCRRRGLRRSESLGGIEEGESMIRLVHAEAFSAVGDAARAAVAISSARDKLLDRAAGVRDPEWRRRFLPRSGQRPHPGARIAVGRSSTGSERVGTVGTERSWTSLSAA